MSAASGKICPILSAGGGGGGRVECLGERCAFFIRVEGVEEGSCAILEGMIGLSELSNIMEEILETYKEETPGGG